jgi:hypothetical protein
MPGNIEPAVMPIKRRSSIAELRSLAGMSIAVRKLAGRVSNAQQKHFTKTIATKSK